MPELQSCHWKRKPSILFSYIDDLFYTLIQTLVYVYFTVNIFKGKIVPLFLIESYSCFMWSKILFGHIS